MILQTQGITKRFGGLEALSKVTFDLPEGQILGLIGPNGAGKTTLFNVMNGVYPPEEGKVLFRGKDITGLKPYDIAHRRMARTHQIVKPLNELTVRENVMVGACYGGEGSNLTVAAGRADQVLELVGISDRAEQLAGSLKNASSWPALSLLTRFCSSLTRSWPD
jgi:branched-chain amino acid transport system ATP-binding protein